MKAKMTLIAVLIALLLGSVVSVKAQYPLFPDGHFPGYTVCMTYGYVSVYRMPRYGDRYGNMEYPFTTTRQFIYLGRVAQDDQGQWWRWIVTDGLYSGWILSSASAACVSTYIAK